MDVDNRDMIAQSCLPAFLYITPHILKHAQGQHQTLVWLLAMLVDCLGANCMLTAPQTACYACLFATPLCFVHCLQVGYLHQLYFQSPGCPIRKCDQPFLCDVFAAVCEWCANTGEAGAGAMGQHTRVPGICGQNKFVVAIT